jgi:hypothetical protein
MCAQNDNGPDSKCYDIADNAFNTGRYTGWYVPSNIRVDCLGWFGPIDPFVMVLCGGARGVSVAGLTSHFGDVCDAPPPAPAPPSFPPGACLFAPFACRRYHLHTKTPVNAEQPRSGLAGSGLFLLVSGACKVTSSATCIQSPNYPNEYNDLDLCEISVAAASNVTITVTSFRTETGYDYLDLGSGLSRFSGTEPFGLEGAMVHPGSIIKFTSNERATRLGFEICGAPPSTARYNHAYSAH